MPDTKDEQFERDMGAIGAAILTCGMSRRCIDAGDKCLTCLHGVMRSYYEPLPKKEKKD